MFKLSHYFWIKINIKKKMNHLKILRALAILEGTSYLLLFITMPMKYAMNMPTPNYIVGMAHGVLFIAYCLWVLIVGKEKQWTFKITFLSLLASIIPIGTFVADAKIFKLSDEGIK
jgi:integral membrane protein